MSNRPLLMIPGPIEVSRAVVAAAAKHPASHVAPDFIQAMGRSLDCMRAVWLAGQDSQPFIVAGSGTTAMDMTVFNLVEPGEAVLVVNTGYFSDRFAEMFRRRGAHVVEVPGADGSKGYFDAPELEKVAEVLATQSFKVLAATHVDTSTGVRVDAKGLCQLAQEHGALSVFDGVCATAGERFEMASWGADVYLTASQKAIGLPPGLALLVASARALEARDALKHNPPMSLDWHTWLPIMKAYEEGKPSYFATPATSLVAALDVSLCALLADGSQMEGVFELHERSAKAMRAAWSIMGLTLLPKDEDCTSNLLSAIKFPQGIDGRLMGEVAKNGVVVAGGLHPMCRSEYFRVGHMGNVLHRPDDLMKTVRAIGDALCVLGHDADVVQAEASASALL